MTQLVLDLGFRSAWGREDFLVSESNAASVAVVDQWPQWPGYAAAIVGPAGSGKTHLAEVFRVRAACPRVTTANLATEDAPDLLASGALVIEHEGPTLNSRALFHTLNLAKQLSATILLTSAVPPAQIETEIPDLHSRLKAVPYTDLRNPDDALLRGVLVKLFADRQIMIPENVIAYLVHRMPRSLGAARAIVSEIDASALAEKSEITRPLAARVLERFTNPELFGHNAEGFT
jgi:chromosomal replication initiation ATPase DnaA